MIIMMRIRNSRMNTVMIIGGNTLNHDDDYEYDEDDGDGDDGDGDFVVGGKE